MTESTQWHQASKSPGRLYQCPDEFEIKYNDLQPIIDKMRPNLQNFMMAETAVRIVLDGPYVNPVTTVISVPFEGDQDKIFDNLGKLIFDQMWGYYISTDPRTTHHGLTNLVFDGYETSMIRRETEKFMRLLTKRNDLIPRVMQGYHMACDMEPFDRDVYMKGAVSEFMDIHLGVRLYTFGEGVQRMTLFMPISGGDEAIDRIYYNIEHIMHQNLVAYDETHDHQLPVSEELLCRELEGVMKRAQKKGTTRKKMIHGLNINTVLLDDPSDAHSISMADLYYDKINRIDLLDEASSRARDLFNNALIRSAEIVNAVTDVSKLKMEERVYIDRESSISGGVPVRIDSTSANKPAAKAATPPSSDKEPVTVAKDGLEEL